MNPNAPGVCPNCREAGEVGTPCPEKGCMKRGYHRVPADMLRDGDVEREIGLLLDGRYLLARLLGEGGFGRVFVALQMPLGRQVAVKVLKKDHDHETHDARMKSFRQEAEAMARLTHPNIVQIQDFGFFEGAAYLVLEYVGDGVTLKDELKRRDKEGRDLTIDEVEAILSGILYGLEEAHAHRIVHRDIKPENVMLQVKPGHPYLPRILDFGLAKFVDAQTQSSAIMGTVAYMAPEQLTKRDLGPWTDLYALGVMAYELMIGRRPFAGEVGEILADKRDPTFDVTATLEELDVPEPIRAFLGRALAFDPKARFRSAPEFREAMQAALRAAKSSGNEALRSIDLSDLVDRSSERAIPSRRASRSSQVPIARPTSTGAELGGSPAPRSRRGALIGAGLGVAALIVVLVVVLSGGKQATPEVDATVVAEPTPDVAAPPVEPTTAPAPSTTLAVVDASRATPEPTEAAKAQAALYKVMYRAEQAVGVQRWDDALAALDEALVIDPTHEPAKAMKARVESERLIAAAFDGAQAAQAKGDLAGAWEELKRLAAIPPDSFYVARVQELKTAVGAALADQLVAEAQAAFDKKQWQAAISKGEQAREIVIGHAGAEAIIGQAKKSLRESRETSREDLPKPSAAAASPQPTAGNADKVDSLLDKLEGAPASASAGTALPDKLSAASVRSALKGRFSRCGAMITSPGPVSVMTVFVISATGVVRSAQVTDGAGTGPEVQRCVVDAIKSTRFGQFTEPSMQVKLPVRLP
ncbi:MAG: protein kinase [Deltaproteobacteria bacterium]|nr:protein kinase [Deltaproteobacteria bacterium]